eukprot:7061538-Pyramimonas_sp.AAC.2
MATVDNPAHQHRGAITGQDNNADNVSDDVRSGHSPDGSLSLTLSAATRQLRVGCQCTEIYILFRPTLDTRRGCYNFDTAVGGCQCTVGTIGTTVPRRLIEPRSDCWSETKPHKPRRLQSKRRQTCKPTSD